MTSPKIFFCDQICLFLMALQFILLANPQNNYANPPTNGLPLFYWQENPYVNFGDYLSLKLVERIVKQPLRFYKKKNANKEKKLLAIGSILTFAWDNDVVWGSGVNGNWLNLKYYTFKKLDVRAVRGPLTREFLIKNFQIDCPEIYGDPALLVPYLFPEFQKKADPSNDYIIIPHYSERTLFPKELYENVVDPTDSWDKVIEKILDSKFVISSSLHGLIIAEAFGIPARQLRVTENESLFKYRDYYLGTNRPNFRFATSVQEALEMGGEEPFECDLNKLYEAFPLEFWVDVPYKTRVLECGGLTPLFHELENKTTFETQNRSRKRRQAAALQKERKN